MQNLQNRENTLEEMARQLSHLYTQAKSTPPKGDDYIVIIMCVLFTLYLMLRLIFGW